MSLLSNPQIPYKFSQRLKSLCIYNLVTIRFNRGFICTYNQYFCGLPQFQVPIVFFVTYLTIIIICFLSVLMQNYTYIFTFLVTVLKFKRKVFVITQYYLYFQVSGQYLKKKKLLKIVDVGTRSSFTQQALMEQLNQTL